MYSTYFGGSFSDDGRGIAVDATGHAYVAGTVTGDAAFVTTHLKPGNPGGVVVLNLAPDGSLVWATDFGSFGSLAFDIAVDGSGATYVTGHGGAGLATTSGAFQIAPGGGLDAFVAKLNPTGTALVYATYLGGSGEDQGQAIAVDGAGNAYVTGATGSTNFPTMNPFQPASGGGQDAFVAKLDPTGSALVYATYLGGGGGDEAGSGIAVDSGGRAYVTGRSPSADFPTVSPVQAALGGGPDAFLVKLDASGSALVYSTYLGGTRNDSGNGVAVDGAGNVYLAGRTESLDFPTAGAMQPTLAGGFSDFVASSNAFVAKLRDAGPAGSGFTVGPTTATPDPVGPGGIETIQTRVTAGSAGSNIIVDLEIYSATGQRVGQRIFTGQTFAAGEGRTYTWVYPVQTSLPEGEYTVKVGIFSGDWSTLHVWENHAADFTVDASVPPPPGSCTGGFTVGPTSAMPRPGAPAAVEDISTKVCSGAEASNILVDLEIYNASGARVAQNVITGQSFTPSQTRFYHWPWLVPAGTPAGTYTVKIGVFSGDWSVLHTWDNQAATFQVGGGSPPPPGCTGGFTVGPTAASPTPVARGAVETIQTRVCSGTAASNILVDLEIYNAAGQKIAQRIFTNQSFSAGETLSYTWSYVVEGTLPSGTYTVKIGVFSGDWSVLHKWENRAATFVVQ